MGEGTGREGEGRSGVFGGRTQLRVSAAACNHTKSANTELGLGPGLGQLRRREAAAGAAVSFPFFPRLLLLLHHHRAQPPTPTQGRRSHTSHTSTYLVPEVLVNVPPTLVGTDWVVAAVKTRRNVPTYLPIELDMFQSEVPAVPRALPACLASPNPLMFLPCRSCICCSR